MARCAVVAPGRHISTYTREDHARLKFNQKSKCLLVRMLRAGIAFSGVCLELQLLHQLLASSFRDFVRTDRRTDRQTKASAQVITSNLAADVVDDLPPKNSPSDICDQSS